MEANDRQISKWKSSTRLIFWSTILISFAGIVSTIYDYLSYIANIVRLASNMMSKALSSFGGSNAPQIDMSEFVEWGFSSKGLVVIGYILYLWGLTAFASIQRLEDTAQQVRKVRTAAILLIIVFILDIIFDVLSLIPFTGWFFSLIIWIMTLCCFYKMKHAFEGLMQAEDINDRAKRGARNLRYAAACEIRLRWLPLVTGIIVIVIIGMAVMMMTSSKSLEAVGSLFKIAGGTIMVVCVTAGIIALCAMFCAFWWPIMGWYRVMKGAPSVIESEKQFEPSSENVSSQQEAPYEPLVTVQEQDVEKTTPNEDMEAIDIDEAETDKRKKWYVGGGILAAILIGLGLWFAFSGSSSNNPLGVEKPTWKKFIVVISQDVPLHKDARSDSPKLMKALENLESDMAAREFRWEDQGKKRGYTLYPYNLEKNAVLPVLDETDTWYKVQVCNEDMNGMIETAYVKKEWTREIFPEPITEEVLARIGKTVQRCDHIVKSGKLKNLCLTTRFNDMDGESFQIGALIDGILIYPQYKGIFLKRDGVSGVSIQKNEEYDNYTLTYGEDCQRDLDEYSKVFNPQKLTDEKIGQIFEAVNQVNPSAPIVVEYYFPEANKDYFFKFAYIAGQSNANVSTADDDAENTKITGYRVSGHELLAELGEAYEETNIIEDCDIEIADVGDYDGNGDMEAVVYKKDENLDGMKDYPFVVYYNRQVGEYRRTNPLLIMTWISNEEWNGKTSLVQSLGVHKVRYVFDGSELKVVENNSSGIGETIKTWTCKELFPNGEMDTKNITFDIDGDGTLETIIFGHDDSKACAYGKDMYMDKIVWADGRTIGDEYFGLQSAYSFSILESKSGGMHDILLDEAWYFRWNGSMYEQWQWDGTQFRKIETE